MVMTEEDKQQLADMVLHFGAKQLADEMSQCLLQRGEGLDLTRGYGAVLQHNAQRLADCARVIE